MRSLCTRHTGVTEDIINSQRSGVSRESGYFHFTSVELRVVSGTSVLHRVNTDLIRKQSSIETVRWKKVYHHENVHNDI
jgi:hypothetical protein